MSKKRRNYIAMVSGIRKAFDRARWSLIDRQPLPRGRYPFAPTNANLSLTRQCHSQCAHCAPASHPHSTETLTLKQIDKFLEGLRDFPIEIVHVEGGEPLLRPELLFHTFERAASLEHVMAYQLETNLFWCHSYQKIDAVLGRLARMGFEDNSQTLVIAGNIDRFHSPFSPLENNLRLIEVFYDYFPNGRLVFSHTYGPGDNSPQIFANMLAEQGILIEIEEYPVDRGKIIVNYSINVNGIRRELAIDNKFPVLVGRGQQLRTPEYLEWRRNLVPQSISLHDGESVLYPNRPVPEIFSLGWNGLMYHDAMFMHTKTYPIGDIEVDSPDEVLIRANKDPLLRRLIQRGFGSVYRVARQIVPGLAEKYGEAETAGLNVIEFALDTLSDPEANLRITERVIEEETFGQLPKEGDYQAAVNFSDTKVELGRLLTMDWTGMEHRFFAAVIDITAGLKPAEKVAAIAYLKAKGETGVLTFSILQNTAGLEDKIEILKRVVTEAELLEQMLKTNPFYYQDRIKETIKALLQMLVIADYRRAPIIIEEMENKETAKIVTRFLDDLLAVGLEPLVAEFLAAFTQRDVATLLSSQRQ